MQSQESAVQLSKFDAVTISGNRNASNSPTRYRRVSGYNPFLTTDSFVAQSDDTVSVSGVQTKTLHSELTISKRARFLSLSDLSEKLSILNQTLEK